MNTINPSERSSMTKALSILVFMLSTMAMNTYAADDTIRAHNPPDFEAIGNQLGLDSYQSAELERRMRKHHQAMRSMHEQSRANHQQIHQLRQAHREDLLDILSYEQLYQLDAYMQKHHPRPGRDARMHARSAEND